MLNFNSVHLFISQVDVNGHSRLDGLAHTAHSRVGNKAGLTLITWSSDQRLLEESEPEERGRGWENISTSESEFLREFARIALEWRKAKAARQVPNPCSSPQTAARLPGRRDGGTDERALDNGGCVQLRPQPSLGGTG